jgi:hypothetical protein
MQGRPRLAHHQRRRLAQEGQGSDCLVDKPLSTSVWVEVKVRFFSLILSFLKFNLLPLHLDFFNLKQLWVFFLVVWLMGVLTDF